MSKVMVGTESKSAVNNQKKNLLGVTTTIRRRKRDQEPASGINLQEHAQAEGAKPRSRGYEATQRTRVKEEMIRSINETISRAQHNRRVINEIKNSITKKSHKERLRKNHTTSELDLASFSPGCFKSDKLFVKSTKAQEQSSVLSDQSGKYRFFVISSSKDPRSLDIPTNFIDRFSAPFSYSAKLAFANSSKEIEPLVENAKSIINRDAKVPVKRNLHAKRFGQLSAEHTKSLKSKDALASSVKNSRSEEAQLAYVDRTSIILAQGSDHKKTDGLLSTSSELAQRRQSVISCSRSRRASNIHLSPDGAHDYVDGAQFHE